MTASTASKLKCAKSTTRPMVTQASVLVRTVLPSSSKMLYSKLGEVLRLEVENS